MKPFLIILLSVFTFKAHAQINANSIVGFWVDSVSQNRFQIEKSAKAFTIKIVALSAPLNDKGLPKTDAKNPESNLRSRPILGMEIASGIIFDNKTTSWIGNEIYSPEKGMSASCVIYLKDPNHLKLVASKYFIKMEKNWIRYEK
jgi:hypothetical protein